MGFDINLLRFIRAFPSLEFTMSIYVRFHIHHVLRMRQFLILIELSIAASNIIAFMFFRFND